jgi:hypothetical protein
VTLLISAYLALEAEIGGNEQRDKAYLEAVSSLINLHSECGSSLPQRHSMA